MAKKTRKSALADRLNKTGVREETRTKAPEPPRGGSLPPGINGGIAKLTKLDFDPIKKGDNEGDPRFYMHGVCVSPKTVKHNGATVTVEGALVQPQMITLGDTKDWEGNPVPFEENWAEAENRMKLIGIPTEDFDDETIEQEILDFVEENDIYFRFRTWLWENDDKTKSRVKLVIEGPALDYEEGDEEEEVEEVEEEEEVEKEEEKPKTKKGGKKSKKEEVEEEEEEEVNYKVLGRKAKKGDEKAQDKLEELAEEAGIDHESYEDWAELAKAIEEGVPDEEPEEEEEGEEEEEDGEIEPEVDDIYGYKPPRAKKDHECEVVTVNKRKKTCTLKSLESDKQFKNVPWDKLSEV